MPVNKNKRVSVLYNGILCGYLIQNKESYTFKYCQSYVDAGLPAISYNMPLQTQEFETVGDLLHSFFDNLASEGWLREHQANALKTTTNDTFAILTHFGFDMAGAVYFDRCELNQEYPMTIEANFQDTEEKLKRLVSVESRASISGVQKKVLVRKQPNGEFTITKRNEMSTHIAKLNIEEFPEIVELEFLSSLAVQHLLPEDSTCNVKIGMLKEINEKVLFVNRFDRNANDERIHFEEFNSLLDKGTDEKYNASYDDIGRFIRDSDMCQGHQRLTCLAVYKRILAYILIGNTDAHLKNFAMFHTAHSLVLTPMYDVVCSLFYPQFNQLALKINNQNYNICNVKPKILVNLGIHGFGLSKDEVRSAVECLGANLEETINVLKNFNDEHIVKEAKAKQALVDIINKRWNGSVNGIPKYLDKIK